MKFATCPPIRAPTAPTNSRPTSSRPNRNSAVATPLRQPFRASMLTPGSMARERNRETTIRNSSVCSRENSQRATSVTMNPTQNSTTALSTQRGMVAVSADGSIHGVSASAASSAEAVPAGSADALGGRSGTAAERRSAPRPPSVTHGPLHGCRSEEWRPPRGSMGDVDQMRQAVADAIRSRVGGPSGEEYTRSLFASSGPRWFGQERPIWRVHADASIFVGALRALLLQSLHPLAMAGVADHSDYRHDPWGRLQRTARFLTATTYGTAAQAEEACARVRQVHQRVRGVAPDGRPYDANDPHLLTWVHLAEVDSFLAAHQRFGAAPLDRAGCDAYVDDLARVATELGVPDPPRTVVDLRYQLAAYRPELGGAGAARDAARFLLLQPPVPLAARAPYTVLGATAVSLLPWWAKVMLRIPPLPVTETIVIRPAGKALVSAMRWALAPGSPTRGSVRRVVPSDEDPGTLAG